MKAVEKAMEAMNTNYEKIPVGIFYKESRPTYEELLPALKERALVEHECKVVNVSKAYEDMV